MVSWRRVSPGSAARVANAFYEDDEAVVWACADVLREEYKRITDAGLTVQIDAPDIAEGWDQINPERRLRITARSRACVLMR